MLHWTWRQSGRYETTDTIKDLSEVDDLITQSYGTLSAPVNAICLREYVVSASLSFSES